MLDVVEADFEGAGKVDLQGHVANGTVTFKVGSVGAATGGTNTVKVSCTWKRDPGDMVPNVIYEADGSLTCGSMPGASRVA